MDDDLLFINLDEDEFEHENDFVDFDEDEFFEGCLFCFTSEHYSLDHLEAISG